MSDVEIYCEDCGARFRNDCHCDPPVAEVEIKGEDQTWRAVDGHLYIGDPQRASQAWHDTEHCGCPQSKNFDPDRWY